MKGKKGQARFARLAFFVLKPICIYMFKVFWYEIFKQKNVARVCWFTVSGGEAPGNCFMGGPGGEATRQTVTMFWRLTIHYGPENAMYTVYNFTRA